MKNALIVFVGLFCCLLIIPNISSAQQNDGNDAILRVEPEPREEERQTVHEETSIMGSTAIETSSLQFTNIKTRLNSIRSAALGQAIISGLVINSQGIPLSGPMYAALDSDGNTNLESVDYGNAYLKDLNFFLNGTISLGDKDGTSKEPSYDFDTLGITGGADYRLNDNLVLGAAFGYSSTDNDFGSSGSVLDTDGVTMMLYGTYNVPKGFYVDGIVSFGFNNYDMDRDINFTLPNLTTINQTAKSDTDGTQFFIGFSGGYDFSVGGFTFGPLGRITFTDVDIDSFSERINNNQPGNQLNSHVDSQDIKSLTSVLGGQATYAFSTKFGVLLPQLRVEWEHEYKDSTRDIDATLVSVPGTALSRPTESPDRNFFNLGLGLVAVFKGGKSAYINYETVLSKENVTMHNVSFGLRFEF